MLQLIAAADRLESEGSGVRNLKATKECLVYFLVYEDGVKVI